VGELAVVEMEDTTRSEDEGTMFGPAVEEIEK